MRTHYVYWVRDLDGVLLYVGCTSTPEQRYRQHLSAANGLRERRGWFTQFPTKWRFRGPLHYQDARDLEASEIAAGQPIFNVAGRFPPKVTAQHRERMHAEIADYFTAHGRIYPQNIVRPVLPENYYNDGYGYAYHPEDEKVA